MRCWPQNQPANYILMKKVKFTLFTSARCVFKALLLFTTALYSSGLAAQSCDPLAEFSYGASAYCQNSTDPTPLHTTGSNGTYSFSVVSGGPALSLNPVTGAVDLSASNPGVYNVTNSVSVGGGSGAMVITGVVDGPLTGGIPKAIELYALQNIPDLSIYSLSAYFNGNTNAGSTFVFPAGSVSAGTRIWVATESTAFTTYFGFAPTYTNGVANINGDDAIRLFVNGTTVVDVFGQVGTDGTGTFWDYLDGWAYRVNSTGADGNTFVQANWIFSGTDALDGTSTNAGAANPWPIGSYTAGAIVTCSAQIEIVAPPSANAGPNFLVCEGTTITLGATGTGQWSGGTGTFSNVNAPNAVYSPVASEIGTTVLLTWTVQSAGGGVCTSASDVAAITILAEPDAEFSYDTTYYCPNGSNPVVGHITGKNGLYSYVVVSGGPSLALNTQTGEINLAASNLGTYQVTNSVSGCGNLVISGIIDGPITGGLPKAVEFYALADIPDLSEYGFGSANNGGGTDGEEFTFPAVAITKGSRFWVATESSAFQSFFGFPPAFTSTFAPSINGDDAIELFCSGQVIDVFGNINQSGTGQAWEYMDGWAYRKINTGPDGTFFEINNWTFSGINALDNVATNASAPMPVPLNFTSNKPQICPDAFHTQTVTINDTEAPVFSCPSDMQVTLNPGLCDIAINFAVSVTDNCSPNPILTQTDATGYETGDLFPIGVHVLSFEAEDLVGNTSTCTFQVEILEFPNPTSTIACNDLVQATLDQDGDALIGADMVLEGGPYGCYDDYLVEIFDGTNNMGNELHCNDIGETYVVRVTDTATGQSCWAEIFVEDKTAPVINNCQDRVVACTANINQVPKPTDTDNCDGNPTMNQLELTLIDEDACDDNVVKYKRSFISFDNYGNTSAVCTEIITVERPSAVDFPSDITWHCTQYASRPNIINPTRLNANITDSDPSDPDIDVNINVSTGTLSNTGSGIPSNIDGQFCMYGYVHADEKLEVCSGSGVTSVFKIVRTWTVLDWCSGQVITTGVNGEDNVQVIQVLDLFAPTITVSNVTLPANVTGIHPDPCMSTGTLPLPTITDNCSGVAEFHIFTPVGEAINGVIPAPGLGLGNHTITVTALDKCGNFATKTYTLTVNDSYKPITICDEITDVNLSSLGDAEVFAETFDDGTFDNCCLDRFEVRRMTDPCNDGENDLSFDESVHFCCADVSTTTPVTVVFRAYDCFGNTNDCMVQVFVSDKTAPVLVSCPANQRITCDWYAQNLETQLAALTTADTRSQLLDQAFGTATFLDNCQVNITRTFASNIDQCLEGSITRTWVAKDNGNNTSGTCSQTIFIDHVSDWVVEFPVDLTVTCGNDVPDFGEPEIFYETCELVAISYEDEVFNVVPDACYKILRTWTIINWCVVGTNPGLIDEEVVEQPENQLGLPFPQCDLDNDGDCDGRTFRDSWRSGTPANQVRPSATDATRATVPDTDLDTDPWDGYVTYQQTIKVIDTVEPVFVSGCQIPNVCIEDNTCAATVTLPTPEVTDCSSDVTISAQIRIGGLWVNGYGPFLNLPPDTYQVRYTAIDNCNNQTICNTSVKVVDCKKPTPYCKTGIVVSLMNSTPPMIQVWASDLNDNSFDNCTQNLKFSFSQNTNETSVTYDCSHMNTTVLVNIWVTDAAGNQDFCQTQITVQDNANVCADPFIAIGGSITNEDNEGIQDVEVNLSGSSSSSAMTAPDGSYQFNSILPGGDYTLVPSKDVNPLNGVTTFDLVLITKHILGTQPLDSPYKIIAADANKSNSVTTFDLVEIRKLILFVNDNFPNNTSWRFVKKDMAFPTPGNPWQTPLQEIFNVNNLPNDVLTANFTAIKVGDVNGSAATDQLLGGNDERSTGAAFKLHVPNRTFEAGEIFSVPFSAENDLIAGFQFTLNMDQAQLELVEIVPGTMEMGNFGLAKQSEGAITGSWNRADGQAERLEGELFSLVFKAKAGGTLKNAVSLNSRFTKSEAYGSNLEHRGVELWIGGETAEAGYALFQNVPNPFSDYTVIGFELASAGKATLTFSDLSGRTLKVVSKAFDSGYNEVRIKRSDLGAQGVVSYRLESQDFTATKKMVLLK